MVKLIGDFWLILGLSTGFMIGAVTILLSSYCRYFFADLSDAEPIKEKCINAYFLEKYYW